MGGGRDDDKKKTKKLFFTAGRNYGATTSTADSLDPTSNTSAEDVESRKRSRVRRRYLVAGLAVATLIVTTVILCLWFLVLSDDAGNGNPAGHPGGLSAVRV
ncbi:hypothetical protein B0T19DRAFT_395365 [Cercophora scortea]|uniref:Uncharacterized protein n=1 Tax=Cercophora scortea TaxID=314031 RepID=A0AAE0J239_9PEZI|nr:hypothetical protein B0T19DRAFT_395365 [Cercophora scortea]